MKNFLLSILLLAALVLAAAPARGYEFSDSGAGFSIKLPDDWVPLADPQAADLISILSPTPSFPCVTGFIPRDARDNLPALIIQQSPYPDGKSHGSFSRAQVEAMAAEMSGLQAAQLYRADTPVVPPLVPSMAKSATYFSNPPGFVIDTRTRDKFRVHTVVFLGENHMVLLHFLADNEAYDGVRPAADQIARSFSFHYFQRASFLGHLSGLTAFDYVLAVVLIVLLVAAVGGIFYLVYHRRPSDNV